MSWSLVKLSNVAEVIAGQSPESKFYNSMGKGMPFFQGKADFGIEYPTVRYWTTKQTKIAEPLDILFSVRAPVGPTNICNVKSCIGRGLASIRVGENINYRYLYYYLKSIEHLIADEGNGSTFSAITTSVLKDLKIPLPPLPIQKRIAEILDAADALKRKDQELLKKYDELAQALFIDMFGDPVKNEKGWEIKTIEQIVKKQKNSIKRGPFGGSLKKEVFFETGYLVYEQYHALNNDFTFGRYFIDEDKYNELIGFKVEPDDIIISCSGIYLGKLAIIPKNAKEGIINQALLKLTLDQNIYKNDFFVKVFSQENFKEKYFDSNRGAAIPNFPPMSAFKEFKFITPPIEVQENYMDIIKNIKSCLGLIENGKNSQNLFNSLIQKAFKGELIE